VVDKSIALSLIRYTSELQPQWDTFAQNAKNYHFMFLRSYMDYHSDRFEDHSLMLYHENMVVAIFPANKDDYVLYSHQGLTFGGFLVSHKMSVSLLLACFHRLLKYAKENRFDKIIYKVIPNIYHTLPNQEELYCLFRVGARLYRVDISSTIDYQNQLPFTESRKSGVRKAKKNDVQIQVSNDYHTYMEILSSLLKEKYATKPTHTAEEMLLLQSRFPEHIRLYAAFVHGKLEAGVVIFETNTTAHCKYMATTLSGRNVGALDLLLDTLINETFKSGKRYFDFGISTEDYGQYLNENLIFQKEHCGGRGIAHLFYQIDLSDRY